MRITTYQESKQQHTRMKLCSTYEHEPANHTKCGELMVSSVEVFQKQHRAITCETLDSVAATALWWCIQITTCCHECEAACGNLIIPKPTISSHTTLQHCHLACHLRLASPSTTRFAIYDSCGIAAPHFTSAPHFNSA